MSTPDSEISPSGGSSGRSYATRDLVLAGGGIAVLAAVITGFIVFGVDNATSETDADKPCPAASVANDVLPSVVTISVKSGASGSSGSGETIRSDGYILTNNHVIASAADGKGKITVLFSSGETKDATLVGRTADLDLAVIKVVPDESLPTIDFGTSDSLVVGQSVVALGAPLGLDGSVTSGIVSALGRDIAVPSDGGKIATLPGAIQTDASINPGNSGGALVNCSGDLIGVNTAIATVSDGSGGASSGSVGIGFAIPSDLAKVVSDELIANGEFTPPFVGVTTIPIPEAVAKRFNVSEGLYVHSVVPGGPAAQAGLAEGDVIVSIDGEPADSADSLAQAVLTKQPGDKITIEYIRDGKQLKTTVTLAEQPAASGG